MIKRTFDITLTITGFLFLFPLFLLIAILILLEDGAPIYYKQKRLGLNGKIFWLFKFRSMVSKPRDLSIQTLNLDPEITKVGKIIRRIKIDELPQLINVFLGDMSLVGPRPWLPDDPLTKGEFGLKRRQVRPGLTGLAQINGNIYLTKKERLAFDLQYVDRLSLALDIKIIFKTIAVVFFGEAKFLNKIK